MWQPINTETNKPLHIAQRDWPILIHGAEKHGASFYTIALTADFVRQGENIVFLCAAHRAVESLQQELGLTAPTSEAQRIGSAESVALEDRQLITMFDKKGFDITAALRALRDWTERILVIKNVESVLTPLLWAIVRNHRRLIMAGDFSQMKFEIEISKFPTAILFSTSPEHWSRQRSTLPTYIGDVWQGKQRYQTIVQEERKPEDAKTLGLTKS